MMWCEIVRVDNRGRKRLVKIVDDAGKCVVPQRLRGPDGVEYHVIRKPEYGDLFEIRPNGGVWGVYGDRLEVLQPSE